MIIHDHNIRLKVFASSVHLLTDYEKDLIRRGAKWTVYQISPNRYHLEV